MSEYGLSHEGAFQYLRAVARHNNLGLREAALSVVASGSLQEPAGLIQDNTDLSRLIAVESPPPDVSPHGTGSRA
jgi:hypothetical protein